MTSFYQSIKLNTVELLGLSKDAIHIHIGLLVFILSLVMITKGRVSFVAFIPVLVVASSMEALDLFDDFHSLGNLNWGNSLHDVINTCMWPFLICLIFRFENKQKSKTN